MVGRKRTDGRYGRKYSNILTKDFLYKEYVTNKKTPYIIAKELDINPRIIYNYIEYYNIPKQDYTKQIKEGCTFGWLTTIKVIEKSKNGTNIWLCKCQCGNDTKVPTSRLKNGRAKSCGCYKRLSGSQSPRWKGYCDVSGNTVAELRIRAKKKKMECDVTAKFLWELLQKQNERCAISNLPIQIDINASIDRVDSSIGYIKTNVQWVHKDVNKMKMDLPLDYFIEMCTIISKNKEKK